MSEQHEPLALAAFLEQTSPKGSKALRAAAELRRLHPFEHTAGFNKKCHEAAQSAIRMIADERDQLRAELSRLQAAGGEVVEAPPVELAGVAHALAEGGMYEPCTGCYETEDGHPVGSYAFSEHFKCVMGNGCDECGGLGVIYRPPGYYEEMAAFMLAEDDAEGSPAAPCRSQTAESDPQASLSRTGEPQQPAAPAIDIKAARSFLASFANWKPDPLDDDKHRRALTIALDYLDDLIGPHAKPAAPAPALVPLTDEKWLKLRTKKTGQQLHQHDHRRGEFLMWMRFAEHAHGINGLTVGGDGGV